MLPVLQNHPEKLLEKGEIQGYKYAILYNELGYRCGYLKIFAPHPWYYVDYWDLSEIPAHGGLSFSGSDTEDDGWWIGFDCAYYLDLSDPDLIKDEWFKVFNQKLNRSKNLLEGATIKDNNYVRDRIKELVVQAQLCNSKLAH